MSVVSHVSKIGYDLLGSSAQETSSAMVKSMWQLAGLADYAVFTFLLKINKEKSAPLSAMLFIKKC